MVKIMLQKGFTIDGFVASVHSKLRLLPFIFG